jgi:hypothetical protein
MAINLRSQIQNKNYLTPAGFQFVVEKNRKIDFFATSANLPEITLGVAEQPSYLKSVPVPGEILQFEDLIFEFLIDENLENYKAIHNWMTGLGFPESAQEFRDLLSENVLAGYKNQYSDCTLIVLNSNYNPQFQVKFKDAFPYSLSGLSFDSQLSSEQFFTARVAFKYTIYELLDMQGQPL